MVYEILDDSDMCAYYDIENMPGNSPKEAGLTTRFQYLDDESIRQKLITFSDGTSSKVILKVPDMHCSSCIWLLENLYKLNPGILASTVNFLKKEIAITFDNENLTLRGVVELLASIGYEPQINMDSLEQKISKDSDKDLYLKIGVAGFCFANIMLLSFPEYLSGGEEIEPQFRQFFGYLSIVLALPVFFYSSLNYFKSALNGWKQKMVNMDVPISLGIITLFIRSIYDIVSASGAGFMDSFTGLVFLLLIGKLFEKKTYDTLSFDRDYKSYFPVSVSRKTPEGDEIIPLEKLQLGDRIIIRNGELIPADSVMINGEAYIDYSFVTGEAVPVKKVSGEIIYAGGKQVGASIEIDVIKEVSQSYLTQLWNDQVFAKKQESKITTLANSISRYFTIAVVSIATIAAIYWLPTSVSQALNALTAVLIIACPCALALSTPFTLGNTLRIFGKNQFYLKRISVIEALAKATVIVFDKTGTLTRSTRSNVEFFPVENKYQLTEEDRSAIVSLARQSSHPLSQQIFASLRETPYQPVQDYQEFPGEGISANVNNRKIRMGSSAFIYHTNTEITEEHASVVHAELDGKIIGYFKIENLYRNNLPGILKHLASRFKLFLLTGDNDREKPVLQQLFDNKAILKFSQSPFDKLKFIRQLNEDNEKVLMIGDGLNDAGALKQSNVGISVSDDINTFSPASDAILDGEQFHRLPDFLEFSRLSLKIILVSFGISFLYNFIGLAYAVQGMLSPLIAAILMPVSSISVILFTTGATTFFAKKKGLWGTQPKKEDV